MKKISIPRETEAVLARLRDGGFPSYIVGGCVRDMLMCITPSDYDICTPATPEEVMALFSDCNVVPTGIKHGTVTVFWKEQPYEITTFRSDGSYEDHRHPAAVRFSTAVEDDLSRRDFTVNAMCYSAESGLVDLFGGVEDIENKKLRCVGDAEKRFTEDSLRILRCLRFAARLGFEITSETAAAMYSCLRYTKALSSERIYTELKGILTAEEKCGTVEEYFDVLLYVCNIEASDIPMHTVVSALNQTQSEYGFAVFAALVSDDVCGFMKSLKADSRATSFVKGASLCKKGFPTKLSVVKAVQSYGLASVKLALKLSRILNTDTVASAEQTLVEVENGKLPTSVKELAVTGAELKAIGFEGADIGVVQEMLLAAVCDGTENDKNLLVKKANDIFKQKGELL